VRAEVDDRVIGAPHVGHERQIGRDYGDPHARSQLWCHQESHAPDLAESGVPRHERADHTVVPVNVRSRGEPQAADVLRDLDCDHPTGDVLLCRFHDSRPEGGTVEHALVHLDRERDSVPVRERHLLPVIRTPSDVRVDVVLL